MYIPVVSPSHHLPKNLKGSGKGYSSSQVNSYNTPHAIHKSPYCCARRCAKVMLKIMINCLPANSVSLKNLENTYMSAKLWQQICLLLG